MSVRLLPGLIRQQVAADLDKTLLAEHIRVLVSGEGYLRNKENLAIVSLVELIYQVQSNERQRWLAILLFRSESPQGRGFNDVHWDLAREDLDAMTQAYVKTPWRNRTC